MASSQNKNDTIVTINSERFNSDYNLKLPLLLSAISSISQETKNIGVTNFNFQGSYPPHNHKNTGLNVN